MTSTGAKGLSLMGAVAHYMQRNLNWSPAIDRAVGREKKNRKGVRPFLCAKKE